LITITDQARDWLTSKGHKELWLMVQSTRLRCCSSSRTVYAEISFQPPAELTEVRSIDLDGIMVHYPANLEIFEKRDITLDLKSTLGFKQIIAQGVSDSEFYVQ
jgi:hypothetical protein